MIGIIEISLGAIALLASLVFGIIRMVKTPDGFGFSKAATFRWLVFTLIGSLAGIALIVFGIIALVG